MELELALGIMILILKKLSNIKIRIQDLIPTPTPNFILNSTHQTDT